MANITKRREEIRIAVLPFKLLSQASQTNPFVLGFTEDLITSLSRFIGLSVISQLTVNQLGGLTDLENIKKLNVDYLISGSFRINGETLRIDLKLINSDTLDIVFAERYDTLMETILDTQDQIIEQVVNLLQEQIDFDLLSYSYQKKKIELKAYENYLIGINLLKKGSIDSDAEARTYFQRALEVNPDYALAFTGLSMSYFNEWSCQLWDRWDISKNGAHEYALRAINMDSNDYISLAVLGRTYLFSEEYDKAERCIRKSLRMNPSDASNLMMVAFSLMFLGQAEEAYELYERACELNPLHSDVYFAYGSNFKFEMGEFETSIILGEQVSLESVWVDFPAYLAAAHFHLKQYDQMWEHWRKYLKRFDELIYKGGKSLEEEALLWPKKVNPYKSGTNLEPFWAYMYEQLNQAEEEIPKPKSNESYGEFFQQDGMWRISYLGKSIMMKSSKGHYDLAALIREPEKVIHCLELMGSDYQEKASTVVIDEKAKSAYRHKLTELKIEMEEAEEMNHMQRALQLREEYEDILSHLSGALGLNGRAREVGNTAEKARAAVTWRIRSTIKKIEKVHPELGKHLLNSIKTGTVCSYSPESPIKWMV